MSADRHPYPIGTRVAILADVSGDDVTGRIAGYVAYAYPDPYGADAGRMEDGYAIHLDRGAFLQRDDLAPGARPWIGTIVAHRDAVSAVAELVTP